MVQSDYLGIPRFAKVIDLNKGNLQSLQIFEKKGNYNDGFNRLIPYLIYISNIEEVGTFECNSTICNPNRLRNAWTLIYSKCKGVKKAF